MKKITTLLTTAALMASCCGGGQSGTPAIDLANFDNTVDPKADFFAYTTGGWQKNNPLTDEYARYGSFDVLRENNVTRINDLFAAMSNAQSEPGTINAKISDLYNMGLDSVRLNKEGLAPLMADIQKIQAATTREELLDIFVQIHLAIDNPLFGIGVGADLMDSNKNTLYISQSGLGMGSKDYYTLEDNAEIKVKYEEYLSKVFALVGIENAAEAAAQTLALEDDLASAARDNVQLRDVQANYNPMSRADFEAQYSNFDWAKYFAGMGVGDFEQIIVGQPEAIAKGVEIFATYPVEQLKNYLIAGNITSAGSYMSDDIYALVFDFYSRTMSGAQEPKARWKRAMSVPNSVLGEAVGEIYVEKYFPEEDKQRMLALVENLRIALGQHIDVLTWMSDETKAAAHKKLDTFTVKVGYPDTWKDYTELSVDTAISYWDNMKVVNEWYTRDQFAELSQPVDRAKWQMTPQTVNAYYNPTTNEICFPAAILQPPFYNPNADDAVNYGAIGVVIGHEMTHGFDDQGCQFDELGNMNNWWTEVDSEAFKTRTSVLVDQFDAIEVLPGMKANGSFTLGENIADHGGLRVAYSAWQNSLGGVEPAPIDNFTGAQRFYIAYANLWAQNIRDEEVARLTRIDPHSLGELRVNQSLKNIQEFYDAFDIQEGDSMYLAPEKRVIIW